MRLPDHLRVSLRSSRVATVVIASLAVAAFCVWLTLPGAPAYDVVAAVALIGWARHHIRLHGTRSASNSVVEIMLTSDETIVVRRRDGRVISGWVRAGSFVQPSFTSVVWRAEGERWSRTLPIVADMLNAEDFRRLRVLLRYGRREVTAGAPASQA